MTHLTELRIDHAAMDLDDELEEALLVSLPTVRVLSLPYFPLQGTRPIGAKFCRIFSTLFPNLEELSVNFHNPEYDEFFDSDEEENLVIDVESVDSFGMKAHLGLFSKLRKYNIGEVDGDY